MTFSRCGVVRVRFSLEGREVEVAAEGPLTPRELCVWEVLEAGMRRGQPVWRAGGVKPRTARLTA
jgi:hypothetical protein